MSNFWGAVQFSDDLFLYRIAWEGGFQYAQFRKHSLDTKRQDLFSDDLAVMSDYFLWQNSAMFHMVSPRI